MWVVYAYAFDMLNMLHLYQLGTILTLDTTHQDRFLFVDKIIYFYHTQYEYLFLEMEIWV